MEHLPGRKGNECLSGRCNMGECRHGSLGWGERGRGEGPQWVGAGWRVFVSRPGMSSTQWVLSEACGAVGEVCILPAALCM